MVQLPATAAIEYVAACCRTRTRTKTKTKSKTRTKIRTRTKTKIGTITKTVRGPYARSPQVQYVYAPSGLYVPSIVAWRTYGQTKKEKLGPVAPRGVDPRSPNFQGMWRGTHPTYFIQALYGSDPFFIGPKNPHFAKKQTNICRLSGDIIIWSQLIHVEYLCNLPTAHH